MKILIPLKIFLIIVISASLNACGPYENVLKSFIAFKTVESLPKVNIDQGKLIANDKILNTVSVNFDNSIEEQTYNLRKKSNHTRFDYRKAKQLGFNTVRLSFHPDWYLKDKKLFFKWLNKNIDWARAEALYIVIEMRYVANDVNQSINIWNDIAEELTGTPNIAAFSLLNTNSANSEPDHCFSLIQDSIPKIQSIDSDRLIIIPKCRKKFIDEENSFILAHKKMPFNNILYELQLNGTHTSSKKNSDNNQVIPREALEVVQNESTFSENIQKGSSEWKAYESPYIEFTDPSIIGLIPVIFIDKVQSGQIYFDHLTVYEQSPSGTETIIWEDKLDKDSIKNWWGWQRFIDKTKWNSDRLTDSGHNDQFSLLAKIDNSDISDFAGFSDNNNLVTIKKNHQYKVTGYMRGDNVLFHENSSPKAGFKLEAYRLIKKNLPEKQKTLSFEEKLSEFTALTNESWPVFANLITNSSKLPELKLIKQLKNNNTPTLLTQSKYLTSIIQDDSIYSFGTIPGVLNGNKKSSQFELTLPPDDLSIDQVPQFVVFGFDDNILSSGMSWATSLFENKKNPAGNNNPKTFDGEKALITFFMNTKRFNWEDKKEAELLVQSVKTAYKKGHEIANHTHDHHADINKLPWDEFQSKLFKLTEEQWYQKNNKAQQDLINMANIPAEDIRGFRAPYLSYNQALFETLENMDFIYDSSIEEGFPQKFDGTNLRWPYRMDIVAPAYKESWSSNPKNPNRVHLAPVEDLWQLPQNVLFVPKESELEKYGISSGLWQRMLEKDDGLHDDHRITGFDYNLWYKAKLKPKEVLGILKYNLDLRLQGNRAPLLVGLHSQYYTDKSWVTDNNINATNAEMRWVIEEFLEYTLSKKVVRVTTAINVIKWMEDPSPL